MNFPPLPQHVTSAVLRRLNVIELMILCERFGARQIAVRMGVDLTTAIQQAAAKGQDPPSLNCGTF